MVPKKLRTNSDHPFSVFEFDKNRKEIQKTEIFRL